MSEPKRMKVWEETWRQSEGYPEDIYGACDSSGGILLFEGENFGERAAARARLAAAAPEMAQVLLTLEWKGRMDYVGDGGYDCCSCCEGVSPEGAWSTDAKRDVERGTTVIGHKPDCALDTVLRKAGVR